jgi:hypothetical protein
VVKLRFLALATACLVGATVSAEAGPCTKQITQMENQIRRAARGPDSGPTATQTVGAQLHHQPTPGAVENAEARANADGRAALERAREADAAGDAKACGKALAEARALYGL